VGMLNVESRREDAFDQDDETMLALFAGQALIAIQNAQSYTRAELERERFRQLYQVGAELGAVSTLDQLEDAYAMFLRSVCSQSHSRATLRRFNPLTEELWVARAEGYPTDIPLVSNKLGEGLNGQVARTRQRLIVHDRDTLPPGSVKVPTILGRSVVIMPIQFREQYYGNLTLTHAEPNHFLDADVELFEGLAMQLALTIYRLEVASAQQIMQQRVREAEAMSSIGEVAFELAHRLGNDLGLVRTNANQITRELAALGVDSPVIAHKLNQIVQDVRKVLDLSRELRSEMGGLREDKTQQASTILVRELLEETSLSYPAFPKSIEVQIELAEDHMLVRGVYQQIANTLRNLFVNAVEAMHKGGVITLRARASGRYVAIQIEDTGPGIPTERHGDIFNLFYSSKGSSGFGLWSARRNVLANGGELTVESQPGQTIFTLALPRGQGSTAAIHET
jgi:signal transduction histidine kinase